jgi:hypothetical protein
VAGDTGIANPTGAPVWSRESSIGDYGGDPDKRASATEGTVPFAYQVYRELQAQRGSAYSVKTSGTLVHAENIALARLFSAVYFRHPEKLRANALPGGSDERLDYWVEVLRVPTSASDQQWQVRKRAAAQYQAAVGPTAPNVVAAIQSLLGDALVDVMVSPQQSLSTPPYLTYWYPYNPGPRSHDLGGGTWLSERCHLFVKVTQPPGMTDGDFRNLLDVQLFALLDRMLPAWATFAWGEDGFFLDGSPLDLAAFDGGVSLIEAIVTEGAISVDTFTGDIETDTGTGVIEVGL